jgi:hypothetical protein
MIYYIWENNYMVNSPRAYRKKPIQNIVSYYWIAKNCIYYGKSTIIVLSGEPLYRL